MNKKGRSIYDIEFLPSMHRSLHFILRTIEKYRIVIKNKYMDGKYLIRKRVLWATMVTSVPSPMTT